MIASYSVAMTEAVNAEALTHLVRRDGQEDLCFAIWYPSAGSLRTSALLHRLILPANGERALHGNASFNASFFERALFEAVSAGAGLALLHSHPFPGWQDMSRDDVKAEELHAGATKAATGLPLVGLTVGTDGAWSARFWEKTRRKIYQRRWCTDVRVVGHGLRITFAEHLVPPPSFTEELRRTVSAWGAAKQADLMRLRIGVVGVGSVGEIVAEALARMGICNITIIDFDRFEALNRDRSLHATVRHVTERVPKIQVVAEALRESATAEEFEVLPLQYSIVEEKAFRAALDCDLLFACVDRPWGRSVLNFIAYAHLIPVIDGGIRVDVSSGGDMHAADWRAHTVGPGRRCLACMGQYDPGLVAVERDGYLDDPTYIQRLPREHVARRNENVFAFSLSAAAFQVLQMLSTTLAPLGVANVGEQLYHFVPGIMDKPTFASCAPECLFPGLIAKGDRTGLVVTGRDARAEARRAGGPCKSELTGGEVIGA